MIKLAYVKEKNGFDGNDEHLAKMTHICYSFAKVVDKNGAVDVDFKYYDQLQIFRRKNPEVRVSLAIGGWGAGNFSEAVINEENRNNFVNSVAALLEKYQFDGVDLDWEYPGSSEGNITSNRFDKQNFSLMISLLRDKLGDEKIISFACGALESMSASYDFEFLATKTDFMNIMTYDMGGSFNSSGYQTNLYDCSSTNQKGGSYFVELFDSLGYPKEKMVYGCAFYGRGCNGLSNYNNGELNEFIYGEEGLYFDYHEIEEIIKKNNIEEKYDEHCVGVYIMYDDTFITYDNEITIQEKLKYVDDNNLSGIMFWEHETDKTRKLINVIINYD